MNENALDRTSVPAGPLWCNWAGNQRFQPSEIIHVSSEQEVQEAVRKAVAGGHSVRAAGSGHSFTPIVETGHTLLHLQNLAGVVSADATKKEAVIRAGTKLSDIGEPLWNCGLALHNQGDTDGQTLAGALATGTKGSGKALGSLSSTIKAMRLVDGKGELVEIDGSDPELLHAAQVSLGLLGVMTEVTLDVAPAYRLQESNRIMPLAELLQVWDDAATEYRHFSFFWVPGESSSEMYSLPRIPADQAWVKFLTAHPVERDAEDRDPMEGIWGSRNGRSYLIYPDVSDEQSGEFVELEYMIPEAQAKEAFLALRHLMLSQYPDGSPIQVRWQRADSAYLSGQFDCDSVSISVSGARSKDFHSFLMSVHHKLRPYTARPHWGKMHYLEAEDLPLLYPELDRFLAVRKQFDPDGIFLNPHLRKLFGL